MTEQKLIMTVEATVESCTTPKATRCFFKYTFCHGLNWSIAGGANDGVSQEARTDSNNICIWNYPINISFRADKPFGWPQVVFSVSGKNQFGNNVVVGFGAVHIPTSSGRFELDIPLFAPQHTSLMQKLVSKITGDSPEFIRLEYLGSGDSRDVSKTESQGSIKMTLNVLLGGTSNLDLVM